MTGAVEHTVTTHRNPLGCVRLDGHLLPPGWVWFCSCTGPNAFGSGFADEAAALEASRRHTDDPLEVA